MNAWISAVARQDKAAIGGAEWDYTMQRYNWEV
jgi:hypothetical protein